MPRTAASGGADEAAVRGRDGGPHVAATHRGGAERPEAGGNDAGRIARRLAERTGGEGAQRSGDGGADRSAAGRGRREGTEIGDDQAIDDVDRDGPDGRRGQRGESRADGGADRPAAGGNGREGAERRHDRAGPLAG